MHEDDPGEVETRDDVLLIIAGGLATRLGPLTATMSKALVTVGQRPMIVRQIIDSGLQRVVVVTSRGSYDQVKDMLDRCLPKSITRRVVVQPDTDGPVSAIKWGLITILEDAQAHTQVHVLFADTLVADWTVLDINSSRPVAAVGDVDDVDRSWTYHSEGQWFDGVPPDDNYDVFIGYFTHPQAYDLYRVCVSVGIGGVADLLNEVDPQPKYVDTWYDTGDIAALTRTRRELFTRRDHHKMALTREGTIIKSGTNLAVQSLYLSELPPSVRLLFPRIVRTHNLGHETEYVDLPSLAELWLYWPGRPSMWKHIIEIVLNRMSRLWTAQPAHIRTPTPAVDRARIMLIDKLKTRLDDAQCSDDHASLVQSLLPHLERIVETTGDHKLIHGDLNFCNILYGLGTDQVRLLDPRGSWGDDTGLGDVRYEYAKLRYSWYGFAAVAHDLEPVELIQQHYPRITVLDELLSGYCDLRDVAAIEASLFLSAIPLHPKRQHLKLIQLAGLKILEARA